MDNRDLFEFRKAIKSDALSYNRLDELGFIPTVYQRIFFIKEPSTEEAHEVLTWLWDRLRAWGYGGGNRKNIAVLGYPLTNDLRSWELFADVSPKMFEVAFDFSSGLMQTYESRNIAIVARLEEDPFAYLLPNLMLSQHTDKRVRFSYVVSKAEVGASKDEELVEDPMKNNVRLVAGMRG